MRLIFYIIIAYIVYVIAKKFLLSAHGGSRGAGPGAAENAQDGGAGPVKAEETVLDPVCKSYIAKDSAISVLKGGKTHYFCGTECRDKFNADGA